MTDFTLLVVDDEQAIRETVAMLARRLGAATRTLSASGVDEAETLLATEKVDALITDLRMPGRSGLDLLQGDAVRKRGIRCALMTGYQEDVIDGVTLADLPVVAILRKPFNMQQARETFTSLGAPGRG